MTFNLPTCRRWLHMGVGTMLLSVALVAVGNAWFRSQIDRVKDRNQAIAQVEALGGRVLGMGESAHPRPDWLLKLDRALGDYGEATSIVLPESIEDEDAERIARLFPEAMIRRNNRIVYGPPVGSLER